MFRCLRLNMSHVIPSVTREGSHRTNRVREEAVGIKKRHGKPDYGDINDRSMPLDFPKGYYYVFHVLKLV